LSPAYEELQLKYYGGRRALAMPLRGVLCVYDLCPRLN
jgi:hypothetical protein